MVVTDVGSDLLKARSEYSARKLSDLSARLRDSGEIAQLTSLSVYATGSFARQEASQHSDIDLFFVHDGPALQRLEELRLFAKVIEVGEDLGFPKFSNDGEFLRLIAVSEMLEMLGGREDDSQNFFTARMLMLLESAPLVNQPRYDEVVNKIVDSYFCDYPSHTGDFRPVFLINDILRFWKTLCLNYEHRRFRPRNDEALRTRQSVKNFKLKFSRLMTCFGTVVALCARRAPVEPQFVVALTKEIPLRRFMTATEGISALRETRAAVLEDYSWFLGKTALSTDALQAEFATKEMKQEMFRRADAFGCRVYDVLRYFADEHAYTRYLLV